MENRAIAYLNNEVRQDGIDVEYKGANLSLMITNSKTKKRLVGKENNIRIRYDVELEGHIHGFILDKKKSIETEEMLEEMQDTAARHIKQDADKVIEKLQKEFGADAIFVSDHLRKYHPKLWKEIQNDWEKIFPQIDIEVNVKVSIRRRGLTT